MIARHAVFLAVFACATVFAQAAPAAKTAATKRTTAAEKPEIADRKADLHDLREKIEALQKDISAAESSRSEASDQLRDAERSISHIQQELHALGSERGELQASLRELAQQAKTLGESLAAQQNRLAKLLYNQYLQGAPDSLQLLLNGDDPGQIARDLHYLGAVANARGELLVQLDETLKKKRELAGRVSEREATLATIEAKRKEKHERLLEQRAERQATLARIASDIAARKKEVGALQRDEKRLTQLIDRLGKMLAARAAAARRQAAKPAAGSERGKLSAPAPEPAGQKGSRPAAQPAEQQNVELPQASPSGGFARLKGSLRLPVRGSVANRFGAPRQEGSTWKGLFIRSAEGSEVKAIAGGNVVFADWMRGFGNLLIVDHGDGYLSIYGNNEALLKNVGDRVRGGDTVASVGNSGGNPESGLYFEIRHQGQAVDPLKWATLK